MLYSKEQAEQEAKALMQRNKDIVREFNEWMRPKEEVRVEVVPKQYPIGWALGATLYFGDSIFKEYDFAEGAYLDLNEMVLKKMLEKRKTQEQEITGQTEESNYDAIRKFNRPQLAHILMCPYEHLGDEKRGEHCSKVASCVKCLLRWFRKPYDANHPWFCDVVQDSAETLFPEPNVDRTGRKVIGYKYGNSLTLHSELPPEGAFEVIVVFSDGSQEGYTYCDGELIRDRC